MLQEPLRRFAPRGWWSPLLIDGLRPGNPRGGRGGGTRGRPVRLAGARHGDGARSSGPRYGRLRRTIQLRRRGTRGVPPWPELDELAGYVVQQRGASNQDHGQYHVDLPEGRHRRVVAKERSIERVQHGRARDSRDQSSDSRGQHNQNRCPGTREVERCRVQGSTNGQHAKAHEPQYARRVSRENSSCVPSGPTMVNRSKRPSDSPISTRSMVRSNSSRCTKRIAPPRSRCISRI